MKAAEGAGLKAMLVKHVDDILDKAASFTGVQVHSSEGSESSEISSCPFSPVESVGSRLSSQLASSCDETSKHLLRAAFRKKKKTQREMKRKHRKDTASLANAKEISMDARTVCLDC